MPVATTSATASMLAATPVVASAALFAQANTAGLQFSSFSPPEVYTPRFVTTLTAGITGLRPTVLSVAATQAVFGSGTFSVSVYDAGTDANPVNFEAFEVIGGGTSLNWTVVTESGWSPTSHASGSTVIATVLTPRSITQPLVNHTTVLATPDPHPTYVRKSSFSNRGDLILGTGGNGQYLTLPAATDGQFLQTDSTRPTGVRWGGVGITSILQHMGDLVVGGALGIAQRFGIGNVGQILAVSNNPPAIVTPTTAPIVVSASSGGALINGQVYNFAYAWQTPNSPPDGGITQASPVTAFTATTTGVAQVQVGACPVAGGSMVVYGGLSGGPLYQQVVLSPASNTSPNIVLVATVTGSVIPPSVANTTGGTGPQWRSLTMSDFPATATFTGEVGATDFNASGLNGTASQSRFVGGMLSGPPTFGTFVAGDYVIDQAGTVQICIAGGTPGTWSKPIPYSLATVSQTLITGNTINTAGFTATRVNASAAVSGIILQAGTYGGQQIAIINESSANNTVTFAASGSHVAGANSDVLPGGTAAVYTWDSGTTLWYGEASGVTGTIDILLTGGGFAITAGVKGDIRIDHSMQILGWYIYADQVGFAQFDLWQSTHATFPPSSSNSLIGSGGAKPILSSAFVSQFSNLNNWTTALAAGTILRVNLDSVSTITRATLALQIVRTS